MASCASHPGEPAVEACLDCQRPLCQACAVPVGARSRCAACARADGRARRTARRTWTAAIVATTMLAGSAVVLLHRSSPPFDYGRDAPRVRDLERQLARAPCDRAQALALAELLARAGDHRGALARAAAFRERCGEYPRLRWVSFAAHEALGEWAAAVEDASSLVAGNRYDKDYWHWRAKAWRGAGDWGRAAADLWQVLALCPRCEAVPFELAEALRRAGRACEGRLPVELFAAAHPSVARHPKLAAFREEFARSGCPDEPGGGSAVLEVPAAGAAVVDGLLDGAPARLALDLDAAFVVVAEPLARSLGLAAGEELLVRVAGRLVPARRARLGSVEVAGLRAQGVEAAIAADADGADARVGLSFLARFELRFDPAGGRLAVRERARAAGP